MAIYTKEIARCERRRSGGRWEEVVIVRWRWPEELLAVLMSGKPVEFDGYEWRKMHSDA